MRDPQQRIRVAEAHQHASAPSLRTPHLGGKLRTLLQALTRQLGGSHEASPHHCAALDEALGHLRGIKVMGQTFAAGTAGQWSEGRPSCFLPVVAASLR